MCPTRRIAVAYFLLFAFLASPANALFSRRSRRQSTTGRACDRLTAGTWNVEHYRRRGSLPGKQGDLIGRSLLNLTRSFENAYTGNGAGIYYSGDLDSLNGYEFVYQIMVSLNPRYCILSGSLYNFQTTPRIIGALRWHYDGEKISGPVNTLEKQPTREAYDVDSKEWFELTFED